MSDMTHRHLRHKLQSLSRRLDELEEATNKLQKSEDELLDIQDKIIQAEGSNSSLLADVEALRKRLLKIQGKDEEVRKAEDLCRTVREKLEEEENLTMALKAEIEHLQRRMAELEKLEEAFGKSKSDCSQLCLSLNEEKNLTRKLSTELEALKARLKEIEGSEVKLDKAEQTLAADLDKLKGFCQAFENEHKRIREKQREDEKIILKLTEKLEHLGMSVDPGRADFMRSRIEEELSSTGIRTSNLTGRKKSLDYTIGLLNKSENQKNSGLAGSTEEDNKVKELTQEVERLKNRLKQLEIVEDDLKSSESKNGELHEKFQMERDRARQLSEQVEELRTQLCSKGGIGGHRTGNVDKQGNGSANFCPSSPAKHLENGKAENEEIAKGSFRQEKPKYRSAASVTEPGSPKHRVRELSPQHKRETKLRTKELGNSEESSAMSSNKAISPAHKSRRTPKTPNALVSSDNGIKDTGRGTEEKAYKGTMYSSLNTPSSDIKKVSVLSRYPPAAHDQKPLRTAHRQSDGDTKKSRMEKMSKLYGGSDTESNNSDVVPESSTAALEKDTELTSDQESIDPVQHSASVTPSLSKANGSYKAYRSNVNQLLPNDQGSEGHSSASETESTGSRPSEPETVNETTTTTQSGRTATSRYSRFSQVKDSHSECSSSRSSFDEEKAHLAEGGGNTSSGLEVQRVCSPREALRSKAVIKPAIVEIDRKEMMNTEPLPANGKPRISTKPILTNTSKITSSITIYPNDPSSSRNSSRSSSVSSEPLSARERHTSTSNFLIGPSGEHHGSVSVPYEISIPKSEITMRSSQDQDPGADHHNDSSSKSRLHSTSRVETATRHTAYQHSSSFSRHSPDATSADLNDMDSAFESSNSSTTFTSWQNQSLTQYSQEERIPDAKNVTVRSTWKNKGVASDEKGRQRAGGRVITEGGSEDEAESATTWRAYLATTVDSEDSVSHGSRTTGIVSALRAAKPPLADMSTRTVDKDAEDLALHRGGSAKLEAGALGRTVSHAPVTSQSWSRSYSQRPQGVNADNVSWRQHLSATNSVPPGSSYDRSPKTTGSPSRGEQWSSRGQASGRSGAGGRVWTHRQAEHR